MKASVIFACLFVAVSAQVKPYEEYKPQPYVFNYIAEGEEGSSRHQEESDGAGNVRGSYELSDADGRKRVVEYIAGANGFHATVRTNEPGTDNKNPADVIMESTGENVGVIAEGGLRSADNYHPRARPVARAMNLAKVPVDEVHGRNE